MNFRITGLAPDAFLSVFGLPDDELAARGIKRYRVDCQVMHMSTGTPLSVASPSHIRISGGVDIVVFS